jgi:hypothetical protein
VELQYGLAEAGMVGIRIMAPLAVAADSGNGISAILDFARYRFVNLDLTIDLLLAAGR